MNQRTLFIMIFVISSGIGLIFSIANLQHSQNELDAAKAELEQSNKDLAYAYGECVFYYEQSVEDCNRWSENKGLPLYEKYYGDGSWTLQK